MRMTRSMLDEAVASGVLGEQQARALWDFLVQREQETPSFKPAHILYYLGGLIAIGAMTLFMTLGWERFGGGGLVLISLVYCVAALLLTEFFLSRRHLAIPAGITATLAVVMVPLGVYGAQHLLGFWPSDGSRAWAYRDYHTHIDWRWLLMELATLAAGAVALWRYRLPFLVMPVAVTLWYMSMDLASFLLQQQDVAYDYDWELRKLVSLYFGLAMTLLAFWVDLRSRFSRDYAFWLYLFGVLTFWGGLSSMDSASEWGKLAYCGINVAMILIGTVLGRRVFAVFGGLGVAFYLGDLSWNVFRDSLLFPFALSLIGLAIIALGVRWQRREAQWAESLRRFVPGPLRELIEARAAR